MERAHRDWQHQMRKGNRGDAMPSDNMPAPDASPHTPGSPSGSSDGLGSGSTAGNGSGHDGR